MVSQFEVYWVNLNPTIGAEMQKTRPCVVVSPQELNDHLDTVIIVPITSHPRLSLSRWLPHHRARRRNGHRPNTHH